MTSGSRLRLRRGTAAMRVDRWEHGSDFHYLPAAGVAKVPWRDATLVGSGRDAFRVLLAMGRAQGWKRLWCPTYYCQDVVAALLPQGIPLVFYPDLPDATAPRIDAIDAQPGDAILVVNHFGTRARPPSAPPGAVIIEDHTHDLLSTWALESDAHYAVASLRKTLPFPDGGVVWSPRGCPLPPEPELRAAHARAALDRLSAMLLKARYLEGEALDKDAYRALAIRGEAGIAASEPSAIVPLSRELLSHAPTVAWRAARSANYSALRDAMGALRDAEPVAMTDGSVPFAMTLRLASRAHRDRWRGALIDARIYPAILWSLDVPAGPAIPAEAVDFAARSLSIHCDQRYTCAEMVRVAETIRRLDGEGVDHAG